MNHYRSIHGIFCRHKDDADAGVFLHLMEREAPYGGTTAEEAWLLG